MKDFQSKRGRRRSPLISVIVPTHNRAGLLPRAITSVFDQRWNDWELIVVDDGSTDNTEDVLRGFDDARMKYCRHRTNRGAAAARNTGIEVAEGKYLAFLDSDDEWLPTRLDVTLSVMTRAEGAAGLAYCKTVFFDDRTGSMRVPEIRSPEGNVLEDLLRGWCPPSTSSVLVEREAVVKVGGFDEELASFHDYDLWLRLASDIKFVAVDERLVVLHSHCESQLTTDPTSRRNALKVLLNKWSAVISSEIGESAVARLRRQHMSEIYWLESLQYLRNSQRRDAVRSFRKYIASGLHNVNLKRAAALVAALFGGMSLYDTLEEAWRRMVWRNCNEKDRLECVKEL